MLAATRLTYRIGRFEYLAIVAATALSVAVTAIVIGWMRQSGYVGCLAAGGAEPTTACLAIFDEGQWFQRIARAALGLVPVFPFLAGLVLGVPVIAREIERGTARLAWSLSPSRTRWFLQRVVPAIVVITVSGLAIGVVSEWIVALFAPGVDLAESFQAFHERGALVATSALVAGSIAVCIGAIVGRPVPGLILALALSGVTLLAVSEVHKRVLISETVVSPVEAYDDNDLLLDSRFQLPDGSLLTWDELVARDPRVQESGTEYPFVQLVIPSERYRAIEAREAAVHLAISGMFLAAGALVVLRRRPG
jgi:hypothetical protein